MEMSQRGKSPTVPKKIDAAHARRAGQRRGGRLMACRCSSLLGANDISPGAMLGAIGFAFHRRLATEMELILLRIAMRPTAHAESQLFQADDLGARRLLIIDGFANGRAAFGQAHTVGLANYGILGETQTATDFAAWETVVPQGDKSADMHWSPIHCHFPIAARNTRRCQRMEKIPRSGQAGRRPMHSRHQSFCLANVSRAPFLSFFGYFQTPGSDRFLLYLLLQCKHSTIYRKGIRGGGVVFRRETFHTCLENTALPRLSRFIFWRQILRETVRASTQNANIGIISLFNNLH